MGVKSSDKKISKEPKPASKSKIKESETKGSVLEGELVATATTEASDQENLSAVVTMPENSITTPGPMIGGITTEQLEEALKVQTEQRKLIKDFIKKHLVEGSDFGKIHVVSRDKCPDQYNCKKSYHYSKAVLFKPGQEKIFSLFQIVNKCIRDEETYEMLPDSKNLVAYKCILYRNDTVIGEGRGAAMVGDSRRDANATIKIAEKRARMDACLALGFSEYFAQDLDDPDYKSAAEMTNQRVAAQAEAKDKDEFGLFPREPDLPITNQERQVLHKIILKAGFSEDFEIIELLSINGITDPTKITSGQARELMSKITYSTFAKPQKKETEDESDFIPEQELEPIPDPPREAELVVDDDLKKHVQQQLEAVGFSDRGIMWFMKFVAGRPWAKWDNFEPKDWTKAFDTLQAMEDGHITVEKVYLLNGRKPTTTAEEQEIIEAVDEVFPDEPQEEDKSDGKK